MKRVCCGCLAALGVFVLSAAPAEGPRTSREAIVFVGAHPDDSEGFAATAFLLKDRYELHVVDLTRGELGLGRKGLDDGSTARRRTAEEQAACAKLGATPHFLHEIDGFACAGKPSVDALVRLLDELKPRAVFTHWPVDGHADHVQTAAVVANALRFSSVRPERYFFEVMFSQTANYRPLYRVDVTSTISRKLDMLSCYACQNVADSLVRDNRERALVRGREGGVAFAETFTTFDGRRIPGGVLESLGPLCSVCGEDATAVSGVLVEAEAFADLGGWSVDQQFMDRMGSSFLLAHGLGKPVADARTTVALPAGRYRLWVRTRDWVAPHGAGQFQVLVGGKSVGTFGKGGSGAWDWWRGEVVEIGETADGRRVTLHDLTGFEGRVDALYFTRDLDAPPPPNGTDFAWRRKLLGLPEKAPVSGEFDFCVVGGGFAGMCAAVAAAREGLTVALVQDRPVVGGNGSVECRVVPQGKWGTGPFPNNRKIMEEFRALIPKHQGPAWEDNYKPDSAAWERLLRQEKTLTLFLSQRATDVTAKYGRIESVLLRDIRTGAERVVRAKLFADCTGDATFAERAGAETMWQPKWGEKGGLGSSTWWAASNRAENVSFPELPWACTVEKELDALTPRELKLDAIDGGSWSWETGFYRDPVKEGEAIRDTMLRGIWGWWAFAKNRSPKKANYAKMEIYQMGYVLGKRDAHRIVGDYVLTEEDLVQRRVYPDGVVDTTWYLDLHTPHGEFRTNGCEDSVQIESYPIPYRCFYSRDVSNLFMAGKDISGTYRALASFRVQNTTAQMGSMVGKAAALCVKNGWSPRELGAKHFEVLAELLKK